MVNRKFGLSFGHSTQEVREIAKVLFAKQFVPIETQKPVATFGPKVWLRASLRRQHGHHPRMDR